MTIINSAHATPSSRSQRQRAVGHFLQIFATDGAKKDDGSDSDLLLMVDNVTAGYGSDGLAVSGGYDSYSAITTGGSEQISNRLT